VENVNFVVELHLVNAHICGDEDPTTSNPVAIQQDCFYICISLELNTYSKKYKPTGTWLLLAEFPVDLELVFLNIQI
jgi:hypothetical protein